MFHWWFFVLRDMDVCEEWGVRFWPSKELRDQVPVIPGFYTACHSSQSNLQSLNHDLAKTLGRRQGAFRIVQFDNFADLFRGLYFPLIYVLLKDRYRLLHLVGIWYMFIELELCSTLAGHLLIKNILKVQESSFIIFIFSWSTHRYPFARATITKYNSSGDWKSKTKLSALVGFF